MLQTSYSKVNSWYYCPRFYYYDRVLRVWHPKPLPLVFGSAIHRALEWLYKGNARQKLKRLENGYSQLQFKSAESFANFFAFLWQEFNQEEKANPSIIGTAPLGKIAYPAGLKREERYFRLLRFGQTLLKKFYEDRKDGPFPLAVEQRFKIPLGVFRQSLAGVSLIGVFDFVFQDEQGRYFLWDYKTGWTFYSAESAQNQFPLHVDFQFDIYSLAFRFVYKAVESGMYWYPIHYKKVRGERQYWNPVLTIRTQLDHNRALDKIEHFVENLGSEIEDFPQTRNLKKCTTCPFFRYCRKGAPVTRIVEPGEIGHVPIKSQQSRLLTEALKMDPRTKQMRLPLNNK